MRTDNYTAHQIESTLTAVRERFDEDFPHFTDALRTAVSVVDPVFFRKRYADFFWHCSTSIPGWPARVLLGCSASESRGSKGLLDIWHSVMDNEEVETGLIKHSRDEGRHSRMFLNVATLAYPGFFDEVVLARAKHIVDENVPRELPPKLSKALPDDVLIDYLIQLNITEIRTRVHLHFLAPVYHAFTPGPSKASVAAILQTLEQDEVSHIGYTAKLIERWAETGDAKRITKLYAERVMAYHLHSVKHTDSAVHDYGQGNFPLMEIG